MPLGVAMSETIVDRAQEAVARGDWQVALALLVEADAEGHLGPAELPVLGGVAYAAGDLPLTVDAWERAHAACLHAGDDVAAAEAAVRVAMHLLFDTALMAPVRGWLRRAERLLEDHEETSAHAWLAVVRTYERMLSGDLDSARLWVRRAVDAGSEFDPAARTIGQVADARLRILNGDVQEGLALLNEAGVATLAGDLDPLSTGVVYCELVCALQGLAQYDVAEEWTEAMERWCKVAAIGSLHGRCRLHRAEILRLRGSLDHAEKEALAACEELRPYLRRELGWPLSELGRIRLRQGRHRRRRAGVPRRPSRRMGSRARTSVAPPGSRRRCGSGGLHTRSARAPLAGALEGAATGYRSAARAAARGAGRDRDRSRRPRASPRRRRRVQPRGSPIPEQGTSGERGPCSRKSEACPGRCGGRTTVLFRSRTPLDRGRRPIRGGARTHVSGRRPEGERQRAAG